MRDSGTFGGGTALIQSPMGVLNAMEASNGTEDAVDRVRARMLGLVNWVEFEERLHHVLAQCSAERSADALLVVDLDRFSDVNDVCGRTAGDALLWYVAALLRRHMRTEDLVGRLGPDEFGVVLKRCSREYAYSFAQTILADVARYPLEYQGRRVDSTASIGIATVDGKWSDVASLLRATGSLCREAARAGGGRAYVWSETTGARGGHLVSGPQASSFEAAIDDGAFRLFGQRIVPLSGRPKGMSLQVSLRQRDPDGTFIPVGNAFSASAYRCGLASRVDRWVLTNTIEWMESLGEAAVAVDQVTISLSGESLADARAHAFIIDLVSRSRVDPYKLCFQFSGKAVAATASKGRSLIEQVRPLGVRIALSDVGTGDSPLEHLRTVSADCLKIASGQHRDLASDPFAGVTVRYICEVAKVLGATTVAEDVDREDVRDALRTIGVELAQGRLFHIPEPLDEVL
jgi:diguanylate cyclase